MTLHDTHEAWLSYYGEERQVKPKFTPDVLWLYMRAMNQKLTGCKVGQLDYSPTIILSENRPSELLWLLAAKVANRGQLLLTWIRSNSSMDK